MQPLFSSVKQINGKIQICGKRYPQKIGDLQICRKRTDTLEKDYHCHNNGKQKQNPDKRKQICLHIEENQAPDKVDGKVNAVNNQGSPHPVVLCVLKAVNKGGADAHKSKKNGPHYGKKN